MPLHPAPCKVLIGPLDHACQLGPYIQDPQVRFFVDANLAAQHQSLQAFGPELEPLLLQVPEQGWADLWAQLPPDWQPQVVIWWHLHYSPLPADFGACPVPLIVIVSDWHLSLATVWELREQADWFLVDTPLYQWLKAKDFHRCSPWQMYSFNPAKHQLIPDSERPYDIAYIGNVSGVQHPQRHHWLRRLARLGEHYRVLITSGLRGMAYTQALNQSKIVFNHSIRGEMNLRCYEAAACGALLFIEAENQDIAAILPDRQGAVYYRTDNWAHLLAHYLAHPQERHAISQWAYTRIQTQTYGHHWQRLWAELPDILTQATLHTRASALPLPQHFALQRQWSHCLFAPIRATALQPLQQAIRQAGVSPWRNALHNALAHSRFVMAFAHPKQAHHMAAALEQWVNLSEQPEVHPIILSNLAWALYFCEQPQAAVVGCQQARVLLQQFGWDWNWPYTGFVLPHPLVLTPWSVVWEQLVPSPASTPFYRQLLHWNLGYLEGLCQVRRGALPEAIHIWHSTWTDLPEMGQIPEQLAYLAEQQQDWDSALLWYQRELAVQPLSMSVWLRLHGLVKRLPSDPVAQTLALELKWLLKAGIFNAETLSALSP